jgi:peroxiredoxin
MRDLLSLILLLGAAPAFASETFPLPPLLDTQHKSHRIGEAPATNAVVVVFLAPDCPICQRYAPTLNTLFTERPKNTEFYGVVSLPSATRKDVAKYAKEYGFQFPILVDGSAAVAAWLKPTHVPEAFVLTPAGKVAYRGRIDDWYMAPGKPRAMPTTAELKDAMKAVAAGKAPEGAKTEPVGCLFEEEIPKPGEAPAKVNFNRHVAPILFQRCTQCHRAGEVAPFELLSFADAAKRAKQIAAITKTGDMPPWKATPGYGHFNNERFLTAQEKAILQAWVEQKAPEGDAADKPVSPTFPDGWTLGKPDLIIKMPEKFTIPANGADILQNFVIPIGNKEDKVVAAMEFRPGNRRVTHHALCMLDNTGKARKLDEAEPGPGYSAGKGGFGFLPTGSIGGWAPGVVPHFLPEGMGRYLSKNSDLVLQVHYHPSGKEETDQSEIGVYFLKQPPKRILGGFSVENWKIDIPAGEEKYERKAEYKLPVDVFVVGVAPHMHLLGKEMKAWAELPNGKTVPLIDVKNWDFNWQDYYTYRKPIALPKGTVVKMVGYHDNSAKNPANPNKPPKPIKYGEGTSDEMSLVIFEATCDSITELLMLIGDNATHLKVLERFPLAPKSK